MIAQNPDEMVEEVVDDPPMLDLVGGLPLPDYF